MDRNTNAIPEIKRESSKKNSENDNAARLQEPYHEKFFDEEDKKEPVIPTVMLEHNQDDIPPREPAYNDEKLNQMSVELFDKVFYQGMYTPNGYITNKMNAKAGENPGLGNKFKNQQITRRPNKPLRSDNWMHRDYPPYDPYAFIDEKI